MSILSLEFLVLTLALLGVHYCLPLRLRWLGMLAGSMAFYAFAGWQGLVYLLAVALVTWLGGLYMGACRKKEAAYAAEGDKARAWRKENSRKRWQACIVLLVTGGMAVIKYAGLIYTGANALYIAMTKSRTPLAAWTLIAPLGLSYFTFQSVGYVVDCARGKMEPEKNPLKYLLFVSFFPQITQGPIATYKQLMPQLISPARFEAKAFVSGLQLMLWGYFKKLVLADRLAPVTDSIAAGQAQPGWLILMGAALYAVRLYADFSGGMDVIRGVAKMLGVDMAENFRRPFFAVSVAEYWRRWHISLGAWFRSYLFYPLTTSRFGLALSRWGQRAFGKKTGRMLPGVLGTFVIFFLIGVWHTANWNAVIYGAYFGLMLGAALMLEPLFKRMRARLHIRANAWWWKAFGMARTWGLILLAQYFAFTAGPGQAWSLIKGTFSGWSFAKAGELISGLMTPLEWYIALAALLVVLAVDLLCERGVDVNGRLAGGTLFIRWPVMLVMILAILIFGCYGSGFDGAAFLYTQF